MSSPYLPAKQEPAAPTQGTIHRALPKARRNCSHELVLALPTSFANTLLFSFPSHLHSVFLPDCRYLGGAKCCASARISLHRHCFLTGFPFAYTSVATMASIPLHCNICPKEPEFSDISHLLTHVASKGHLSHYFKAQVRARQDENIRYKIDRYDRWYDQYQIEKLLSQRMNSKELRDVNKPTAKNNNRKLAHLARATEPPDRRSKKSRTRDPSPSPVKAEEIIDPQLPRVRLSPRSDHPLLESPSHDAATRHRAHIPCMLNWQIESPSPRRRSSSLPTNYRSTPRHLGSSGTLDDAETDYFRAFLHSPTRSIYPDPASFSNYIGQPPPVQLGSDEEKDGTCPSPILKGIKWPGMSLFDSASQEAQRLRNQKKDGSVLEQMEIDSAAIEPMEHIYWPGGRLKKKRLITGNVESSPIKDPTPPPRRSRARASRILATVSTNVPKVGKKRGRKPGKINQKSMPRLPNTARRALTTVETGFSRDTHVGVNPWSDSEIETHLSALSPDARRKPDFTVFRDTVRRDSQGSAKSGASEVVMPLITNSQQDDAHPHGLPGPASYRPKFLTALSSTEPFSSKLNSTIPCFQASNFQPLQSGAVNQKGANGESNMGPSDRFSADLENCEPERVTQRYFSVTGSQPPQFFSAMPPQMDFGGMCSPAFHGTSLNPLNPFLRQQYQQSHYSPAFLTQPYGTPRTEQLHDDTLNNATKKAFMQKPIDERNCRDPRKPRGH